MPKRLSRTGESEIPPPDLDLSELGRLLHQKRTAERLSLRQAAELARVSFSTLSRVEDGAQPDLSTFMSLCAWLGVDPGRFFSPMTRRSQSPLDEAIEHLATDPALSSEAADRIVSVVRDMYDALAEHSASAAEAPPLVHLRAASVMRPGVPQRLVSLLKDMRTALENRPRT